MIELQPKQIQFFKEAFKFRRGDDGVWRSARSEIWFGGAIRGGKSFASFTILYVMCKLFPGSSWIVARKSLQVIKQNTIQKLYEVIPEEYMHTTPSQGGKPSEGIEPWTMTMNVAGEFSKIRFWSENIERDPKLFRWNGLEGNGFLLEEGNELTLAGRNKALTRKESHRMSEKWTITETMLQFLQRMWPEEHAEMQVGHLIYPNCNMVTCNPAKNWAKEEIYDKWKDGTLSERIEFIPSLPTDNPKGVSADWIEEKRLILDDVSFSQYLLGDWEVTENDRPFIRTFDRKRHIYRGSMEDMLMSGPIYLSCDQNVEPPVITVWQYGKGWCHCLKETKFKRGDVYDLAEWVNEHFPRDEFRMFLTGDASGHASSILTKGTKSFYQILAEELELHPIYDVIAPKSNQRHADSRMLCNSVFKVHPHLLIHVDCKKTIADLENARVDERGDLVKSRRTEDVFLDHFDTVRYALRTFYPEWLENHRIYL